MKVFELFERDEDTDDVPGRIVKHTDGTITAFDKIGNRKEFARGEDAHAQEFANSAGTTLFDESVITESEFKKLQKNKKPLTPEERKEVMDSKAVWHHGPNGAPSPAVWKSINPKTGKTTFITHTHRAYSTASTLKGAIGRFHKFTKSTA